MRVLVTGATGLIGRQTLAPLIAAGHEVHGLSRHVVDREGARWHSVDLLDDSARARAIELVGAEALLHLAWHTDVATVYNDAANDRWLDASIDLIARFRMVGGRRAVIAGSAADMTGAPRAPVPVHAGKQALHWCRLPAMAKLRTLCADTWPNPTEV